MTQRTRFFQAARARWAPESSSLSARRLCTVWAPLLVCAALAACSSKPAIPDWQMNAHGSTEKALQAYLTGNSRVEEQEWARARRELASTGRLDLVARAELLRCAAQAASLALTQACPPFEALQQDAAGPEKAYANYLLGRPLAADELALLPPAQRPVATALAQSSAANAAALLKGVEDPLSRLVAAGTLFRAGQAGREVVALAVDAASAQGWRRPLMAWLTVQANLAQAAGDAEAAAQARRRLALMAP